MRAFHSTGSRCTLAVICAGDSSTASGPALSFSSPGGVNGRWILSRYTPSASETAPVRILSQSSSVLGSMSIVPCLETVVLTASKMLSATGSIMYFINSFTETTGLRSPQSAACGADVWAGGGGAVGFDEEHAAAAALRRTRPDITCDRTTRAQSILSSGYGQLYTSIVAATTNPTIATRERDWISR